MGPTPSKYLPKHRQQRFALLLFEGGSGMNGVVMVRIVLENWENEATLRRICFEPYLLPPKANKYQNKSNVYLKSPRYIQLLSKS